MYLLWCVFLVQAVLNSSTYYFFFELDVVRQEDVESFLDLKSVDQVRLVRFDLQELGLGDFFSSVIPQTLFCEEVFHILPVPIFVYMVSSYTNFRVLLAGKTLRRGEFYYIILFAVQTRQPQPTSNIA